MTVSPRLRHTTKHVFCCFSIIAALTLSFSACQKQSEKTKDIPTKVTIAYPLTAYSVLFQIALAKGFFLAEGLEVVPQPKEFGRLGVQSVLEGKADMAISSDTVFIFAVTKGAKLSIVATIATSRKNAAILALKKRGIKTPGDLTGKIIGVALGTTAHFSLDSFLSTQGIDKRRVKIVHITPGEMSNAFRTGRVDAVSVWNPMLKQLERELEGNGVVFFDESIYSDIVCISAPEEFISHHPQSVRKVLKALVRAEAFVMENPGEAKSIASQALKIDKMITDETWRVMNFRVSLDQSLLVNLEDQTRWAQIRKFTEDSGTPNYLNHIYFEGLQSIKPEAVRIIR